MKNIYISNIDGLEILDSRGQPTVKAYVELSDGTKGAASVPSGASTGGSEAVELRDRDPSRYFGLGCRKAVENIRGPIRGLFKGSLLTSQDIFDQKLIEADGTASKSRLGSNAILAVSLAYARAISRRQNLPLYRYFSGILGPEVRPAMPRLTINLFSGGKHAGAQVPIQDVLIVPVAARGAGEALEHAFRVYRAAVALIAKKYHSRWLTADEGGLAPPFPGLESMFDAAMESISKAGFSPGRDIALAIDVAASHFYSNGTYQLGAENLSGLSMVSKILKWKERYPIISIEDGLAEEDWDHWVILKEKMKGDCMIMGDDLLCTNEERIRKAVDKKAANALLLKLNQIGTLYEAAKACRMARKAGWKVTISARSGETEDDWLAELAVGWAGDYIKVGSVAQSERLSKYNRLLEIEAGGLK